MSPTKDEIKETLNPNIYVESYTKVGSSHMHAEFMRRLKELTSKRTDGHTSQD